MGKAENYLNKNLLSIDKISDANFFSDLHKDKKFVSDWVAFRTIELAREDERKKIVKEVKETMDLVSKEHFSVKDRLCISIFVEQQCKSVETKVRFETVRDILNWIGNNHKEHSDGTCSVYACGLENFIKKNFLTTLKEVK